jgi:hypothetical protein
MDPLPSNRILASPKPEYGTIFVVIKNLKMITDNDLLQLF